MCILSNIMTYWTKITVAVIAALLYLAGEAQAQPDFTNYATEPEVVYALNVAKEYWDTDLPCARVIHDTGRDVAGDTWDCDIFLYPTWADQSRVRRCETIVHEYGHLLGHKHSRRVNSIMSSIRRTGLVQGCVKGRLGTFTRIAR